uniref:Uncharacterized protein n=1 Tax=Sphingomonas sp. NS2 TaxID=908605 RepID=A0A0D4ZZ43_9SPHN|nr:hypothetical protein plasmid201_003 [Sphingomonas sp. NS2]
MVLTEAGSLLAKDTRNRVYVYERNDFVSAANHRLGAAGL